MRLIDADALKKLMEEECSEECAICCHANIEDGCRCKLIDNVPTIIPDKQVDLNEVKAIAEKAEQERRPGEWLEWDDEKWGGTTVYCSVCKLKALRSSTNGFVMSNFCPNCGADMRKEKKNEIN